MGTGRIFGQTGVVKVAHKIYGHINVWFIEV